MKQLYLFLFAMICFSFSTTAQRTITGVVNDSNGELLIGASVYVKGNVGTGTVTDFNGAYSLEVDESAKILVFSYTGYSTQEVDIGASNIINLTMSEGIVLDELVVTALGISKEEKALAYGVQQINSEALVATQTRSPVDALKGKVAGVQITSASGAPGATTNITLRGTSSLTGNNEALFVIDGVPINNANNNSGGQLTGAVDGGNSVNDLNPEDIESLTILKGASAAALYGSRAANGVILITTKKGAAREGGGLNVELNTSYTYDRVLVLPELQNQFGQGQNGDNQHNLGDQESWGDAFDNTQRPYGIIIGDPSSEFFNKQRYKTYAPLEDNIREFFDIGQTTNTSLAISGGSDIATFRLSSSYMDQNGIVPNTGLTRTTVSLNGSSKLGSRLTAQAGLNYIKQINDLAINGQGGEAPLSQALQTSRDISLREQRDLSNIYNSIDWYYTPFIQNPYFNLFNDSYKKDLDRVYGSATLSYKILDNLSLNGRVGADIISDDRARVKEVRIASALSPNSGADEPGFVREEAYTNKQFDVNFFATYDVDLTEDIGLSALAGWNFNERSSRTFIASVIGTSIPGFSNFSNGVGNPSVSARNAKRRLYGIYGQVDFNYKNFLYLGATYRRDQSSTLPRGNNSFGYPSVYTSLVLTDLLNLSSTSPISFLKVRASYAEVGNDAPVYVTNSTFFSPNVAAGLNLTGNFGSASFPFNGVAGFTEGNRIGNPNLKPERSKEWEVGLDIRLLKNRFNIDVAYFKKNSVDQIITSAQAAPTSGFSFQVLNAGEIENKGVEVLLNTIPVQTANFTWTLGVNFTKIDNTVLSLQEGSSQLTIGAGLANYTLNAIVGEPYGVFQAPTALRDPNGNLVVDGNGLPQQAPNPAFFGNIQPDWLGGITTSIGYKGVTLSATLEHKQGGNIYSRTISQTYFNGSAVETGFNNRERFIIPFSVVDNGDGSFSPNTTYIDYASNNIRAYWNQLNGYGETLIVDATYTKLRELTLTYNFSDKLVKNTPFSALSIGVFGRNLWIHTPDENTYIDPETNSFTSGNTNIGNLQGFEFGTLPNTSSYGANLRVKF